MKEYKFEDYLVNAELPPDVKSQLEARKAELEAEVCQINALIAVDNGTKCLNRWRSYRRVSED